MRWSLVALMVMALVVGCKSAEQERREADEKRIAREARHREIRARHAAAPIVPSHPTADPSAWPSVLDAENAVTYCEEAWRAHLWVALQNNEVTTVGLRTAETRLQKARRDLERVRAGEENVVLEVQGGFPLNYDWVSGYHRADGIYVPGGPR